MGLITDWDGRQIREKDAPPIFWFIVAAVMGAIVLISILPDPPVPTESSCQSEALPGVEIVNPCPMPAELRTYASSCGIPAANIDWLHRDYAPLTEGALLPRPLLGIDSTQTIWVTSYPIEGNPVDMQVWNVSRPLGSTGEPYTYWLSCPNGSFTPIG